MLAARAALSLVIGAPVELDWRAPEECPDAAAVLADLAELTDLAAASAVRVRARTRRIGDRYALDLTIRGEHHRVRRRLETDACDTLAEATALLIAIVIDPKSLTRDAPAVLPVARDLDPTAPLAVAAPEEVPPPPIDPGTTPSPPAEPTTPASTTIPSIAALVRIDGGLDVGATPGPAGALGGGVGVLRRRLRAELHGVYTPPRRLTHGDAEVGRIARWAVGARICAVLARSRVEALICAGLEGGQFLATGTGVTVRPQEVRPPWLAALAGPGLLWTPARRIGVGVRLEAVIAPLRATFVVDDATVHVVAPFGLRATAGVELRLGPGASRR